MIIKYPKIIISLFTFSDIYNAEKGTQFVSNWLEKYPQLFPEKLLWNESKNGSYPVEGVHTFVPGVVTKWSSGRFMPFWKLGGSFFSTRRSKPKVFGSYSFGGLDYQKSSRIKLEISYDANIDWRQVFLDLSSWFEASFGWLHLLTAREDEEVSKIPTPDWGGSFGGSSTFFGGSYPVDRERGFPVRGMPHLGWLNLYGGEFLPLMGKNLPKVPEAHRFERDGTIFVQLSDKITDLITDYDKVEATRREIKAIIGQEYFETYPGGDPKGVVHGAYFFQLDGTIGFKPITDQPL